MAKIDHPIPSHSCKASCFSSILLGITCIFFFCIFSALGTWQVYRLQWKQNLITHVNQRTHLPPVEAPPQEKWPHVTFEKDEYRPVTLKGQLLKDKSIFVIAVAQDTTGYWILSPLQTADKTFTFINRGFIPMNMRSQFEQQNLLQENDSPTTHTKQIEVTGLLRMSEGAGIFPRKNNPDRNLWYTRQLPAMAKKLNLSNTAPYFIDVTDKISPEENFPVVGLTVIRFYNNHLTYAITWFILAAGTLGATLLLIRHKK
ncbi:SURF1 family protein [Bartonella ancashensis]|uniref:SURF1-like protein n=1 Tax=Bartonella ancashensis TaxID=1318743 RepID=A0A0M4L6D8_9HYPH|nr:SURF1 family protein [Bartonella ancashensis]ALE03196.1 Cytochrome oxidase biogenesis protein Surf1, facilitates heme A insertion [Bartonella ancashensis]